MLVRRRFRDRRSEYGWSRPFRPAGHSSTELSSRAKREGANATEREVEGSWFSKIYPITRLSSRKDLDVRAKQVLGHGSVGQGFSADLRARRATSAVRLAKENARTAASQIQACLRRVAPKP